MTKTAVLDGLNPQDIATAAALLRAGECVAVPTETVYGLAAGFGHDLYQTLFEADQAGYARLWLELPPTGDEWLAVNDRLSRAASH